MTARHRLVVGHGTATHALLLTLALALADHAKAAGLRLGRVERSKDASSGSCYLHLFDGGNRPWRIRVSNHRRPLGLAHAAPHFDLVSIDGTSGLAEAKAVIDRIAAGTFARVEEPVERKRRRRHA